MPGPMLKPHECNPHDNKTGYHDVNEMCYYGVIFEKSSDYTKKFFHVNVVLDVMV